MTSEKVDYGDKDLVVRSIKALDGGIDSSTFKGVQTRILQNESQMQSISASFGAQVAQVKGDVELAAKRLLLSTSAISRSRLGNLTPATLTMTAMNQDDTPYQGRFVVDISHNGVDYVNAYESPSDESTYGYLVDETIEVIEWNISQLRYA